MSDQDGRPADGDEQASGSGRRKDGLLTTGDMARLSRNTLRTVRFYEEAGLVQPIQRTDGGHRLFEECELLKLQLISDFREFGLSLEEIKALLEIKGRSSCGSQAATVVLSKLDNHLACITKRIEMLERLRRELGETRTLLAECQSCDRGELFPHSCGNCHVVQDREKLPIAACALWGVRR